MGAPPCHHGNLTILYHTLWLCLKIAIQNSSNVQYKKLGHNHGIYATVRARKCVVPSHGPLLVPSHHRASAKISGQRWLKQKSPKKNLMKSHNYKKSPCSMDTSTIYGNVQVRKLLVYQRVKSNKNNLVATEALWIWSSESLGPWSLETKPGPWESRLGLKVLVSACDCE